MQPLEELVKLEEQEELAGQLVTGQMVEELVSGQNGGQQVEPENPQ